MEVVLLDRVFGRSVTWVDRVWKLEGGRGRRKTYHSIGSLPVAGRTRGKRHRGEDRLSVSVGQEGGRDQDGRCRIGCVCADSVVYCCCDDCHWKGRLGRVSLQSVGDLSGFGRDRGRRGCRRIR